MSSIHRGPTPNPIFKPDIGPPGPATTWKQKIRSITGVFEAILLILLTIGGLFLGWFSPTQAGAIGASGALLIGIIRGRLKLKIAIESAKDGLRTACMVLFIIAGATIFGHFMAISNIPFVLVDWVESLPLPPMAIMSVMILIYFIGGFFMDSITNIKPLNLNLLNPLFPHFGHLLYVTRW